MGRRGGKLPVGVSIRPESGHLRIAFSYRGVQCRETLRLAATPPNIRYAQRLRAQILAEIDQGRFDYAALFPGSKRAQLFGHGAAGNPTIMELLDAHLVHIERQVQRSTYTGYQKAIQAHLGPRFGSVRVRDLTPAMLRSWLSDLTVSPKRARNVLTPLRAVLEQALNDDLIDRNPLDRVAVNKILRGNASANTAREVDPFDAEERAAILKACRTGLERNFWQFAFWTGLRTSELIALEWGDVDWIHGTVRVSRAHVQGQDKAPKTAAGVRDVLLLEPARQALQAQRALTALEGGRIWRNPATECPWSGDQQIRRTSWEWVLKRAGVRYRNPYQTRHTYASTLLSQGENELWVAAQMGHKTVEMVRRHYGRWIRDGEVLGGYCLKGDYSPTAHPVHEKPSK